MPVASRQEAAQALNRMTSGRNTALLLSSGIPFRFHDLPITEENERMGKRIISRKYPLVIIVGKESFGEASKIVRVGLGMRVSGSMADLSTFQRVYKESFRSPELRMTLRNKARIPKIFAIVNIDSSTILAWRDPRDLAWLRSLIQSRVNSGLITILCCVRKFRDESMASFLGPVNTPVLAEAKMIRLKEKSDGENRRTVHNENTERTKK